MFWLIGNEVPEIMLRLDILPFDLDQVTDHGKDQVRQPKRDDHPVDGINPVEPVDKEEIYVKAGEEEVEVFKKCQNDDV